MEACRRALPRKEAGKMFATAVEINGTRPGYHLEYARTLVKLGR